MNEYTYPIECDRCHVVLGWWRYSGPFNGSMRCESCRDCAPEAEEPA